MAGGWFIVLILWIEWVIPGRFIRGIERSKKAMPLAKEALEEKAWSGCLDALRKSMLQSFLFKTYLRFNSKTMRIPEDEQGTLEYFHYTFLPEEERRLDRLAGWRSRLTLGAYEALLLSAFILLLIYGSGWWWFAWVTGGVALILLMALFYFFFGKFIRIEQEYAVVLMELDLKMAGFEEGTGEG